MKKGIIITTILILSIITCNKIKALSLDGTRLNEYKITNDWTNLDFYWYDNGGTDHRRLQVNFTNNLIATRGDYAVFATKGYFKHWDGSTIEYDNDSTIYDNEISKLILFVQLIDTNDIGTRCEFQNNLIVCPIQKNTSYKKLDFETSLPDSQPNPVSISDWYLSIYSYADIYLSNTGQIIESQENTTQAQIDSNQVCEYIDKNNIKVDNKYLNSNGVEADNQYFGITDYIKINTNDKIKVITVNNASAVYTCFYNTNKEKISCISNSSMVVNNNLTIPNNTEYIRVSIHKNNNQPTLYICKNGNQAIVDSDHTYDQNATQDYTNQTTEMDNITNAEDTLMNNLDFNTTDMNITINPNASTFIWNIVDSLRLMSTKIVLLMTSIMSLGIIKLVLNR